MKIFISLYSESSPFMEVSRFIKKNPFNKYIPKTLNNNNKNTLRKYLGEKWATVKPNEVQVTKIK